MENDPPPPQATGNANNQIRNNEVSSDSMVSLISGLSDSVISNQFSILNGHSRQRFGASRSVNGSEDGFGLGRGALEGRRSARMHLRPSMMNDSTNGDGGE